MAKALGVGGFFFRAQNPAALAEWYQTHLGINPAPTDLDAPPWVTDGGVTVFSPFAADTDYFRPDKNFMINFRVDDMDGIIAQLTDAGIEIKNTQTMDGIGRFVHIEDPEGTPIELWQPA
ncbi:VOC family protein [Rhodobacteraceae bacterium]|nr:VOC family protein [Paracoccaceae bacterium]